MLKINPASYLLPKKLKITSSVAASGRFTTSPDSIGNTSFIGNRGGATMTADSSTSGGASAHHHHQHAKTAQSKMNTYFPLGYKEAAAQWVRFLSLSLSLPLPHR